MAAPSPTTSRLSLAELLAHQRTLSPAWAVDVVLDVCEALGRAHSEGVVHGALGARCIRVELSPDAGPRVVEIFALRDESAEDLDLDVLVAAAPRSAPSHLDPRTDVRALGALLHRMLVGLRPNGYVVHPALADLSRPLARIVGQCIAEDLAARPATARDLAEKLASFSSSPDARFSALAATRESCSRAAASLERGETRAALELLDRLDEGALLRECPDANPAEVLGAFRPPLAWSPPPPNAAPEIAAEDDDTERPSATSAAVAPGAPATLRARFGTTATMVGALAGAFVGVLVAMHAFDRAPSETRPGAATATTGAAATTTGAEPTASSAPARATASRLLTPSALPDAVSDRETVSVDSLPDARTRRRR